jgi:hypothetical protein
MIFSRLSQKLRIETTFRFILLASLVLGMLAGSPAGSVLAARGDAKPMMPAFALVAELTKPESNAWIGYSTGLSVNTAVLGAPGGWNNQGEALVFERNASGVWSTPPVVLKSGTPREAQFGYSVAIEGDTIVVGTYGADESKGDPYVPYTGPAVYVYSRNQGGAGAWGWLQTVKPPAGLSVLATGRFGASVSISGDILAVGAPIDYTCTPASGSVYLYQRDAQGVWQYIKTIKVDTSSNHFGWSVALDGSRLVVGAPAPTGGHGEAYLFDHNQGGTDAWGLVSQLMPADQVGAHFGWSVSARGNYIVIGSPAETMSTLGAAYVFTATNYVWAQQTKFNPPTGVNAWYFGYSVSVDSDRVAIGTMGAYATDGKYQSGVYLFAPASSGTDWSLTDTVALTNPQTGDKFGNSVTLSGSTLLVGAFLRNVTSVTEGAGYVFSVGGGVTPPPTGEVIIDLNGPAAGDYQATFHEPILPSTTFVPVPVVDANALTITGPAGATLVSATITLTNPLDGDKEVLAATPSSTVAVNYTLSNGVGVLTLTSVAAGGASLADFQAVLRTVTYADNSWKPDNSAQRVITFVVNTATTVSNTATSYVTIIPEKELPNITFLVNGDLPLRIGLRYTVEFTVARPAGVGPEAGIPSGTVTIQIPGNDGCTGTLDTNGQGSCDVIVWEVGDFTLTANYSGDGEYLPRTQSLGYYFDQAKMWFPFYTKASSPFDQPDPLYLLSIKPAEKK